MQVGLLPLCLSSKQLEEESSKEDDETSIYECTSSMTVPLESGMLFTAVSEVGNEK